MAKTSQSFDADRLALLREWTDEQLKIARTSIFEDSPSNDFSIMSSASSSSDTSLLLSSHDYDDPRAVHLDPGSVQATGLRRVGGVDISFRGDGHGEGEGAGEDAVAVLVVLEYPSMKLLHTFIQPIRLHHPYIPEYLSMRELAPLLSLYDSAIASLPQSERPQVLLVDGNGRMHERQAGLATALGVARNVPTVGVGKEYHPLRPDIAAFSKLSPQPIPAPPWPPITHFRDSQREFRTKARQCLQQRGDWLGLPFGRGGDLVGGALAASPSPPPKRSHDPQNAATTGKPIYVSPGHRVSLASSLAVVLACCKETRVPDPVRIADRIGRDEAKRLWPPSAPPAST